MGKILLLMILIIVIGYVIMGMIYAKRVKKRKAIAKANNDAILARAEQQTAWLAAGDPRGFYGDYPIPEELLKDREPGHMSLAEAEHLIHPDAPPEPPSPDNPLTGDALLAWEQAQQEHLDKLRRHEHAQAMAAKIKEQFAEDERGKRYCWAQLHTFDPGVDGTDHQLTPRVLAVFDKHGYSTPTFAVPPSECDWVTLWTDEHGGQELNRMYFTPIKLTAPGSIVCNLHADEDLYAKLHTAPPEPPTEAQRRRIAEINRLNGIAGATHPAGMVIEDWAGNVIQVLHDRYRQPDTLSVADAQMQLDEAKHQIEWATRRLGMEPVAGRTDPVTGRTETYYKGPASAYQVNAMLAQINAALPAKKKKATAPRKPAKRISERKALEHYVEDLDA